MNILIVSGNYPSDVNPARGTFVYNLVQEICRQGASVTTIVPKKPWAPLSNTHVANRTSSYGSELSQVIRPNYVSFSNKTIYPGVSTGRLSLAAFTRAVKRTAREVQTPDIVYSHFLYPSGFAAVHVAAQLDVPCVVALGESSMERHEKTHGVRAVRNQLHKFSHIITVSSVLRDYCVERMDVDPAKVTVIPNAVDTDLFHPRDRQAVRQKLGLPQQAFIVTYLGHFNERKGYARVIAALERHPKVTAIFIGNGPDHPIGEQVLFAGPLKHSQVPEWLAAGDVFVLPTLAEGYCNAVNEALAVGLPVVVSDILPLREQVDESVAIFVNPRSIDQIADAIGELNTDAERRTAMAAEALKLGQARSLSVRAEKILRLLHDVACHSS